MGQTALKTVHGARTKDGKAPHLLVAMITAARPVITQKDIDAKTNETIRARPLLDGIGIAAAGDASALSC
jgi:hypothetical protein